METKLLDEGVEVLRSRLPPGWAVTFDFADLILQGYRVDAVISISSPDGKKAEVAVEAKSRFEPRDAVLATGVAARLSGMPLLVLSNCLSKGTRDRLLEVGLNWIDLTGNVRLVTEVPGLFIAAEGAKRRPGTAKRPARSLKGISAGQVVRALLTHPLPVSPGSLASRAEVDPGYVSRILELLDSWALIEREPRGPVVAVDRVRLVRRWAEDVPRRSKEEAGTYLEPRGLAVFIERLRESPVKYAITGSIAAQRLAPVASPRLAQVYVAGELPTRARELELKPAEAGANVQLLTARDRSILSTSRPAPDGLVYVGMVQVILDLLTGPGRGPAEAEEILRRLEREEDAWFG